MHGSLQFIEHGTHQQFSAFVGRLGLTDASGEHLQSATLYNSANNAELHGAAMKSLED